MKTLRRPMFRRGGSATGTGVMSYVESPRIKAKDGFGFLNPGIGQIDQATADAFRQREQNRINQIRSGVRFAEPRSVDVSGIRNFGFGFLSPQIPAGTTVTKPTTSGSGILDTIIGRKVDQVRELPYRPGFSFLKPSVQQPLTPSQKDIVEISGDGLPLELEQLERQTSLPEVTTTEVVEDTEEKAPGLKDEPAFDTRTETEKERDTLKALLKDENLTKAEASLAIAEALRTKGGIGKKIAKLGDLSKPIIAKRRKEDRELTLAAYKIAKQKELEQIKAGGKAQTTYMKNIRDQARSFVGTPGYEGKTEEQIYQELMRSTGPGAQERRSILSKAAQEITDNRNKIIQKELELEQAIAKKDEKTAAQLRQEIDKKKREIRAFSSMPEFDSLFPGYRSRLGLAQGGMPEEEIREEDKMNEAEDIVDTTIGAGTADQTQSEPVLQLSARELRDRLPPEITDEVVSLLANNNEALQAFAYIRTQDDVNSFNARYGVNLVIPPERG